jgi:hypothetical protein
MSIRRVNGVVANSWTLFVLAVLFAPAAYAATIASFEQEWSKLVAAAQQEGTVTPVPSGGGPVQ